MDLNWYQSTLPTLLIVDKHEGNVKKIAPSVGGRSCCGLIALFDLAVISISWLNCNLSSESNSFPLKPKKEAITTIPSSFWLIVFPISSVWSQLILSFIVDVSPVNTFFKSGSSEPNGLWTSKNNSFFKNQHCHV